MHHLCKIAKSWLGKDQTSSGNKWLFCPRILQGLQHKAHCRAGKVRQAFSANLQACSLRYVTWERESWVICRDQNWATSIAFWPKEEEVEVFKWLQGYKVLSYTRFVSQAWCALHIDPPRSAHTCWTTSAFQDALCVVDFLNPVSCGLSSCNKPRIEIRHNLIVRTTDLLVHVMHCYTRNGSKLAMVHGGTYLTRQHDFRLSNLKLNRKGTLERSFGMPCLTRLPRA